MEKRSLGETSKYLHILGLFFIIFTCPTALAGSKQTIGQVEKVAIGENGFVIEARIDTGAQNSSLHTTNYVMSTKGAQKWVRFDLIGKRGQRYTMHKPVTRMVKIKRKEATTQQRPAVELELCMGKYKKRVEVNLVNRTNFNYQMLIGRTFLSGHFIVDVDLSHTLTPECEH